MDAGEQVRLTICPFIISGANSEQSIFDNYYLNVEQFFLIKNQLTCSKFCFLKTTNANDFFFNFQFKNIIWLCIFFSFTRNKHHSYFTCTCFNADFGVPLHSNACGVIVADFPSTDIIEMICPLQKQKCMAIYIHSPGMISPRKLIVIYTHVALQKLTGLISKGQVCLLVKTFSNRRTITNCTK